MNQIDITASEEQKVSGLINFWHRLRMIGQEPRFSNG